MPILWDLDKNKRNKVFFDLWVELGTQKRVRDFLANEKKIINPYSGKPYSRVTISSGAYKWVCDHPDEARKVYEKEAGEPFGDEEWERFVLEKAMLARVFGSSKFSFVRWAERSGYYKKYFDVFKTRFGLTENDRQKFMG